MHARTPVPLWQLFNLTYSDVLSLPILARTIHMLRNVTGTSNNTLPLAHSDCQFAAHRVFVILDGVYHVLQILSLFLLGRHMDSDVAWLWTSLTHARLHQSSSCPTRLLRCPRCPRCPSTLLNHPRARHHDWHSNGAFDSAVPSLELFREFGSLPWAIVALVDSTYPHRRLLN